ncbi:MAG: GNAT family N-acetyltransferase [Pseudomonadota bacterium]
MSANPITIRSLGPEDAEVLDRVRDGVFDATIDPAALWAFLATRVNELVVALDRGEVIGFAYGTVLMRPDKPKEFLVNRIGVHAEYRKQGIGRRLMDRLQLSAVDRGCEAVWVLVDDRHPEARGFYRALNGHEMPGVSLYDWDLT